MRPIYNPVYLAAADMSASFNGGAVLASSSEGLSFQATWVGATAGGSLKIQASNDGVNWADLPGTSQTVAGPGSFLWNLASVFFQNARLVFTRTGGTGSLDANVFTKEAL